VHPRVAVQILRHSRISITTDIYSQVAAASTREAPGRLGTQASDQELAANCRSLLLQVLSVQIPKERRKCL
jgi:hypothetical protein